MKSVTCPTTAATQALAEQIGQLARPGTVLLLRGDLGGGKTTFTQGLGRGLGIQERIVSPTFTLIQEYEAGRIPLFHCDLYRLSPEDTFDLHLEDYWGDQGITAIEWPDRLIERSSEWLELHFQVEDDDARTITPTVSGTSHRALWEQARARWKSKYGREM